MTGIKRNAIKFVFASNRNHLPFFLPSVSALQRTHIHMKWECLFWRQRERERKNAERNTNFIHLMGLLLLCYLLQHAYEIHFHSLIPSLSVSFQTLSDFCTWTKAFGRSNAKYEQLRQQHKHKNTNTHRRCAHHKTTEMCGMKAA